MKLEKKNEKRKKKKVCSVVWHRINWKLSLRAFCALRSSLRAGTRFVSFAARSSYGTSNPVAPISTIVLGGSTKFSHYPTAVSISKFLVCRSSFDAVYDALDTFGPKRSLACAVLS